MRFKIYSGGDGCVSSGSSPCNGDLEWTENRLVNSSQGVVVKNGYFSVALGSVTALPTTVWNYDILWLSMDVGGTVNSASPTYDGEMLPFKRIAAAAQAFNAQQLGGRTASQFVQLASGSVQGDATNNNSIAINKTSGTGSLLQLQRGGADVLTVGNNGSLVLQPTATSTAAFNIKTPASGSDANVFTVNTADSRVGIALGSSNLPTLSGQGLEIKGALRLSGGGNTTWVDTFVTPNQSSNVNTKINIPVYNPGTSAQIVAIGLPRCEDTTNHTSNCAGSSAVPTNARALSVFDDRIAGNNQPALNVFSPNESDLIGFSWDGDTNNATAAVKTMAGNIALRTGSANLLFAKNDGTIGIGNSNPGYQLDVTGDINTSANLRTGGTIRVSNAGALSNVTANTSILTAGTLGVDRGGTGIASATAYGLLFGGTTSTGAFQSLGVGTAGQVLQSNGAGSLPSWVGGAGCSTCIAQVPTTTLQNTITPTTNSIVALTVNATSGTASQGLIVSQSQSGATTAEINSTNTSGTQTNGLLVNRNGASGTTTNGINITQTAGTLTNGLAFTGTIGTDINRGSGTLTLQGATGITMTATTLRVVGTTTVLGTGEGGTPADITIRGTTGAGTDIQGGDITFDASNGTGNGGSGAFIFRTASNGIPLTVAYDGASESITNGSFSSWPWSHTVTASSNTLLMVTVVSFGSGVTGAAYNGDTMTQLTSTNSGGIWHTVFYLVNPDQGTHNIVVSDSNDSSAVMNAVSFSGANTTTPFGTPVTTTQGTGTSITGNTVTSATNEIIYSSLAVNTDVSAPSVGGGQTLRNTEYDSTDLFTVATSTKAGAASTTLSYSNLTANASATTMIDVPIKPGLGGGSSANTLTERLRVDSSGNIGIGTNTPSANLHLLTPDNATSAFKVQDSTSTDIINVDTTNAVVRIGASSVDTAGALLVVDISSSSTEPTMGTNGAIYYSTGGRGGATSTASTGGKFRCYEGGSWRNCVGMRDIMERRWAYYVPAGVGATMNVVGGGAALTTTTATSSPQTESNYISYSGSSNGTATGVTAGGSATRTPYLPKLTARIRTDATAITTARQFVALSAGSLAAITPSTGSSAQGVAYIGVAYAAGVNSGKFICGGSNGTNGDGVDTGITVNTNTYYDIIVEAISTSSIACSVAANGGAFTTVVKSSGNFPGTTTNLGPYAAITPTSAVTRAISIAYMYLDYN